MVCFYTRSSNSPPTGLKVSILIFAPYGLMYDPEGLHASFERQAGKKAPGVDGIRKADYAQGLDERITDLSNPSGLPRQLSTLPAVIHPKIVFKLSFNAV